MSYSYVCATCGNPFTAAEHTRKYCSHECYAAGRRKGEERVCEWCGKPYIGRGNRNIRFCSRACWLADHAAPRETYICEGCGKPFERVPAPHRNHRYCSLECTYRYHKPPEQEKILVTFTCQQCGKKFQDQPSRDRKYCSPECDDARRVGMHMSNYQGPSVTRTCDQCGDTFSHYPSQPARFCSTVCYGQWRSENITGEKSNGWRGGTTVLFRGPNWLEQSAKTRERDDYCCQHCGITEEKLGCALDVHHLIPFREFGLERYEEANQLTNLISLCRSCHMKAEHGVIAIQAKLL